VRFIGHPEFEKQYAIAWLVNLLNASTRQDGSDFAEHSFDFGGGQCHTVPHSEYLSTTERSRGRF
jgi:hypothetical protein